MPGTLKNALKMYVLYFKNFEKIPRRHFSETLDSLLRMPSWTPGSSLISFLVASDKGPGRKRIALLSHVTVCHPSMWLGVEGTQSGPGRCVHSQSWRDTALPSQTMVPQTGSGG